MTLEDRAWDALRALLSSPAGTMLPVRVEQRCRELVGIAWTAAEQFQAEAQKRREGAPPPPDCCCDAHAPGEHCCPGWFVNQETGRVERCDECRRYDSDEDAARQAAAALP